MFLQFFFFLEWLVFLFQLEKNSHECAHACLGEIIGVNDSWISFPLPIKLKRTYYLHLLFFSSIRTFAACSKKVSFGLVLFSMYNFDFVFLSFSVVVFEAHFSLSGPSSNCVNCNLVHGILYLYRRAHCVVVSVGNSFVELARLDTLFSSKLSTHNTEILLPFFNFSGVFCFIALLIGLLVVVSLIVLNQSTHALTVASSAPYKKNAKRS